MLKLIKDPRFQLFLILSLIGLAVWFVGPYISIANQNPFGASSTRLMLLLLLALIWGVSNFILNTPADTKPPHDSGQEKNAEADVHPLIATTRSISATLNILQENARQALKHLKKHIKSIFYRYKLPWYLVIGPANVGKSTLFAKSNLQMASVAKQPLELIPQTHYCDWWFNNNAVIIDIAGDLILPKEKNKNTHLLWVGFIKLLKKCRRLLPINGIIITLELNQLAKRDDEQQKIILENLQQHIQTLSQYFTQIPVYIIFTKCDHLSGFSETFTHMDSDERNQAFGINIPAVNEQQQFSAILEERFTQLLQRLHEQMLWRIHQEHNILKRTRIKEFPLQLESQKLAIETIARQIHNVQTPVCGIYFTSSLQDGQKTDHLIQPLTSAFKLNANLLEAGMPSQQAFFINDIFNQVIHHNNIANTRNVKWLQKHFYTLMAAFILSFGCLFWSISYQKNMTVINSIKTIIGQENNSTDISNSRYTFLNKLNLLYDAIYNPYIEDNANSHYLAFGFHQANHLRNTLSQNYQQTLTTQFIPQLQSIVENQIEAADTSHPEQLYNSLKVYLMLSDSKRLDADFVKQWFSNYWQNSLANDLATQQQLNKNLSAIINKGQLNIKPDPLIIASARQILNGVPLANLAYILLQNQFKQQSITLIINTRLLNKNQLTIPAVYTAANFSQIYDQVIPVIAEQVIQGDWVLGTNHSFNLSAADVNQLNLSVRNLYVQNYINSWSQLINSLNLNNLNDLTTINLAINELNSTTSPISQVLNLAETNLKPISTKPELQQITSAPLQQLNNLTNFSQNAAYINQLKNFQTYLLNIINSADNNKTAYANAVLRMNSEGQNDAITNLKNYAAQIPAPYSNVLNNLASQSWQALLTTADKYINTAWQTQVLSSYNEMIANRYPFAKDAAVEVSLENFTRFFSVNGTMDHFFNTYLQSFVDTSQLYWTWKNVDGQHLAIPQHNLELFIRAALIRKMFFSQSINEPNIQFTLMPTSLAATNARDVILQIGKQTINYANPAKNRVITWPSAPLAKITYINTNGQESGFSEEGNWAFFKLLDHADVQTTPDAKQYKITFNIGGNLVSYQLNAENLINPFLPGVIANFHCPDKL